MNLRAKLGSVLVRMGLWLIGPMADNLELDDDEPDLPAPNQDPLTDESFAMMARSPKRTAPAVSEPVLEGSAAARYRRRQTW